MISHSKPYTDTSEQTALDEALQKGLIGRGARTAELETLIATATNYAGATATSSASYAIFIILKSLYPFGGARVALQSYVCRSVYDSIVMANCTPVLFDIDSQTFGIKIKPAEISKQQIDIIIITHLFGVRTQYDDVLSAGIPIIEDCAQRLVPSYISEKQKPDWKVFSFDATKIITCGQGGALAGLDINKFQAVQQTIDESYKNNNPSVKNVFSDLQASVAIEQWKKIDRFLSRRKEIAAFYIEALKINKLDHLVHPSMLFSDTWHFRFVLNVDNPETIMEGMEDKGVACRKPVNPFGLHTLFYATGNFENTENAVAHCLSLPIYPAITTAEAEKVISDFITVYG